MPLGRTGVTRSSDLPGQDMSSMPGIAARRTVRFFTVGDLDVLGPQPAKHRASRTNGTRLVTAIFWSMVAPWTAHAQSAPNDYRMRRDALLQAAGERLVLIPSNWEPKPWPQDGYRQQPTFQYLTGLENQLGAMLLLDGQRRQSVLFVADDDPNVRFFQASVPSGDSSASALGMTSVRKLSELVAFLDGRLTADSALSIAVESPPPFVSVPGLPPFTNAAPALRAAIEARWPRHHVTDIADSIAVLRSIKSPREIEALRGAGRAATAALRAGFRAIAPGKRQRAVETEIAAACFRAGAHGLSWWPWAQTGPNAVFPTTFRSMVDYRHLDRTMRSGELARLDVGCEYGHYHSDVGRTVPVSGRWTPGQAEAWDLLVAGYRAGLRVIRDGVSIDSVRAAFDAGVRAAQPEPQTPLGREAARILLDRAQTPFWQIHGVGLDAAEVTGPVLRRGMVVAYEPMFTVQSFGFYLEDLLLLTETGYEMLTPGLPYTSGEIARAVAR